MSLLFSFTNSIALGEAEGEPAKRVRAFLDEIGGALIPLELNPWTVAKREAAGQTDPTPAIRGCRMANNRMAPASARRWDYSGRSHCFPAARRRPSRRQPAARGAVHIIDGRNSPALTDGVMTDIMLQLVDALPPAAPTIDLRTPCFTLLVR
jgi:hypothetical protein